VLRSFPEVAVAGDPANIAQIAALEERFRAFCRYARTVKNQSPASITWYEKSYENFRAYLRTKLALDPAAFAVELRSIEPWVQWNRERGIAAISANNYWRGLRAFFRDIEQRDGTPSPFHGLKAPRFPRVEPKARSADECRRIPDGAEHYPWASTYTRSLAVALLATMLYAGLRRGEVVQLRYADIDRDNGTILVREGKGAYGGRDRRAYISDDLDAILHRYLRERARRGYIGPEFFVSPKTGGAMSVEGLQRIIRIVRRASGVPFSAHMLRHSFVTHLLQKGVPLHVVSRLAGHRQLTTTMGYAAIFEKDLADGIGRLRF
jgi:integrase